MIFAKLVKEAARREGGKVNLPIAQVTEVVRHTLALLSEMPASQAMKVIEDARKREGVRK